MLSYNVKIGLVPIRRDVTPRPGIFNWEKAEERCAKAVSYIEANFTDEHVSFVDLDGINDVNVLYSDRDVDAVVERFRKENVDAVFLINGNFGNEEVAGAVAKAIGKPVLLWGPQDDSFLPDGTRYTDTQCGLFGMSRMLQRMNIPFTYIENCFIEDKKFADGFHSFMRVACAVKNFSHLRVAQVGMRPKPFCSVIFNEGDLMENFDIHVIPINLALFAVYLAGALLGPWRGALSLVVYLLLAAVGVPVMAGFRGGLGNLVGNTGGYVVGYIFAAFFTGLLAVKWGSKFWQLCVAMVLGCAVCYFFGTLWYSILSGTPFFASFSACVVPFLPCDVVKILLAALLASRLRPVLLRQGLL